MIFINSCIKLHILFDIFWLCKCTDSIMPVWSSFSNFLNLGYYYFSEIGIYFGFIFFREWEFICLVNLWYGIAKNKWNLLSNFLIRLAMKWTVVQKRLWQILYAVCDRRKYCGVVYPLMKNNPWSHTTLEKISRCSTPYMKNLTIYFVLCVCHLKWRKYYTLKLDSQQTFYGLYSLDFFINNTCKLHAMFSWYAAQKLPWLRHTITKRH